MILAAGVSTGVGISKAKLLNKKRDSVNVYSSASVENELARLENSIKATNIELKTLCADMSACGQDSTATMVDKYLGVINNYCLIEDIKNTIINKKVSAEYAVSCVFDNSKRVIAGLDDEYLNEKVQDIEEIKCRLLSKLAGSNPVPVLPDFREECIIVSDDLTPGDVLKMNSAFVKGIVTIKGGPTSSSSMMARRMNIPAVMGVGHDGHLIKNGDLLIVDGNRGRVIINPDNKELQVYGSHRYGI